MTWAKKFNVLKQTLNWPALHMMEYIDAGYTKKAYRRYNDIERSKDNPSSYLVNSLYRPFYVNPAWMEREEGPILLDERRIRSSDDVIRQRAKRDRILVSLSTLRHVADDLNVGLEWLLCGDEKAKDNPINDRMISFLSSHPQLRKEIWIAMDLDTNDEFYSHITSAPTPLSRIKLLNSALGISQNEFGRRTNITMQHLKKVTELQICKVATFGAVSRDWIRTGNTESLAWPCDNKMIIWLREHPEVRSSVADRMR